jgi:type I restriction enzyme S subunit
MGLSKRRLGELIALVDERNRDNIDEFYGINIDKEFMPTVANTESVNPRNYKVLRKGRFVFSGMQTGRDECIRIGLYDNDEPIIVSPAYTTFEITSEDVLPEYFFMLFKRREMDRLGWFLSDSSVRSNLDWDRFCEMTLDLPPLPVQQKYVDVYNAMLANQRAYEQGLEDLKLTCDAYIERLRHEVKPVAIGEYLELSDERNTLGLDSDSVRGLSTAKEVIETKANMDGVSVSNYKTLRSGQIAYVPDTSRRGEKISLAFNSDDDTYLVSSISTVFGTKTEKLLPAYLMMFFSRAEFDRYTRFHSWGSARETFSWDDMREVKIPIPDISVQQAIVGIYTAYITRREINERMKAQIKDICPILIKGSLEEAARA